MKIESSQPNQIWNWLIASFLLLLFVQSSTTAVAQDGIRKQSTWQPATSDVINATFEKWMQESKTETAVADQVRSFLSDLESSTAEPLDIVVAGIAIARTDVARLEKTLAEFDSDSGPADTSILISNVLQGANQQAFVTSHVQLLYGRWLARHQMYDESLQLLEQLKIEDVLDPAALLYYRGLMQHQLLKPKECIETLKQLQENSAALPRRYSVLAKLMMADMQRLEKDSLDEISRMMNDVGRRTSLFRSGKRVRTQEEEVLEKLDKLIKDLEAKQKQMQLAQGTAPAQPASPAQQEQRASGKGSGEVRSKRQNDGGQWGNLDPAQRDAALAEMSRDLPPHYRSVIEEYFRKLAQETEKK